MEFFQIVFAFLALVLVSVLFGNKDKTEAKTDATKAQEGVKTEAKKEATKVKELGGSMRGIRLLPGNAPPNAAASTAREDVRGAAAKLHCALETPSCDASSRKWTNGTLVIQNGNLAFYADKEGVQPVISKVSERIRYDFRFDTRGVASWNHSNGFFYVHPQKKGEIADFKAALEEEVVQVMTVKNKRFAQVDYHYMDDDENDLKAEDEIYGDNFDSFAASAGEDKWNGMTWQTPTKISQPLSNRSTPTGHSLAQSFTPGQKMLVYSATKEGKVAAWEGGASSQCSRFRPSYADGSSLNSIPSNLLLSGAESHLNMLEKDEGAKNLLHADIQTGRVIRDVSSLKASNAANSTKSLDFVAVCHANGVYQQSAQDETLVAVFNNAEDGAIKSSIGYLDLRDKDAVKARQGFDRWSGKDYNTAIDYTCVASTANKWVVTGHMDGSVRLYETPTGVAKTHFKFGDAILGVDVTEDGKYIVATTEEYVVFIVTSIPGEKLNAFQKSAEMSQRPKMFKRMQVILADYHLFGGRVKFNQPARFNTAAGNMHMERKKGASFAAAAGKMAVIWNTEAAVNGKNFYSLARSNVDIAADTILHNRPDTIVMQDMKDVILTGKFQ